MYAHRGSPLAMGGGGGAYHNMHCISGSGFVSPVCFHDGPPLAGLARWLLAIGSAVCVVADQVDSLVICASRAIGP